MNLPSNLVPGTLLRRYKRFLADVALEDGSVITVHCPNSGSMKGCAVPGSQVLLSISQNQSRKYRHTWELVRVNERWVGINTALPNHLVHEAISNGTAKELQEYSAIRTEVPYGTRSRIDLLLECGSQKCFVEVKNVTLEDRGQAFFPDAVTLRGQKHLNELMEVVRNGHRGVIFFTVLREDCSSVSPADNIDPEYGRLLRSAVSCGVEALAYRATLSPTEIVLTERLPVIL